MKGSECMIFILLVGIFLGHRICTNNRGPTVFPKEETSNQIHFTIKHNFSMKLCSIEVYITNSIHFIGNNPVISLVPHEYSKKIVRNAREYCRVRKLQSVGERCNAYWKMASHIAPSNPCDRNSSKFAPKELIMKEWVENDQRRICSSLWKTLGHLISSCTVCKVMHQNLAHKHICWSWEHIRLTAYIGTGKN